MIQKVLICICIGLTLGCTNQGKNDVNTATKHPFHYTAMHSLVQVSGEWEYYVNDTTFRSEVWKIRDENTLTGTGFMISGIDTLFKEQLRIVETDTAVWFYAQVNNQNEGRSVPFRLVAYDAYEYIFENPTHDFPQRITYSLNYDTLRARVSTLDSLRLSTFTFLRK